ncbi:MAG: FapA family protein [Treponema sp.]|nr:FapA family protein [Treponema sp.]
MVDFIQLQHIVKERLEQDRNIRTVTATGATLEDAVSQAATLLNIPVRKLEYEITERGNSGFLGTGKKNWSISAYETIVVKKEKKREAQLSEDELSEDKVEEDVNGEVYIHLSEEGAFIKATAPKGNGRKALPAAAIELLHKRNISEYDEALVAKIVKDAEGEYVRVGGFERMYSHDSFVNIEFHESEMQACMSVSPPGIGGCDISPEAYLRLLKTKGVVYGINEKLIKQFADRPIYKEKIVVAEGLRPEDGRDSYIQYNFETDQGKVKLKEGSDGRIDFKELNIINNVFKDQPLAKKMPPGQGVPGRTVTGKTLPARDGRDTPLPVGKNVHIAPDDVTIISDMNGQVIIAGGKINVEPVHTVKGAVDLKTGNIVFLGTVVIQGNVEDGFSVKAAGNIEVNGTVGRAELDAEGDIIVHQGITGKSSGMVRAGRSIWARFIENTKVEAGNMVVVSDGIINSQVDAYKRIVCRGKRANIVGGRLRASEEINAKILGSPTSGTETVCEVGIDPKNKLLFETLLAKKTEMEKQFDEIQLNIQTLVNIKKQRKSLPKDRETYLNELMDKRQLLTTDMRINTEEIMKIQELQAAIKTRGRVSASVRVYPGVKIIIRDAVNNVNADYRAVTFILEDGLIRVIKYEEPSDEAMRGPDGYTTD